MPSVGSPNLNATIHLRNLPVKQQVYKIVGSSEVEQARTTFEYDGYDNLTDVYEYHYGNGMSYVTQYSYGAMDNLLTVNQGRQTRTFVYDSLSHLKSATNPENGTITFEYDDNGNLKKRTGQRKASPTPPLNVAASYSYDELNRVESRTHAGARD